MDQVNQGESSGAPSSLSVKRRRGRPRKDPSLKHAEAAHAPGFVRMKEYQLQGADTTNGIDIMVGQPVTGVVEATFDAGHLLSVRIGNSDTHLRGVVFKPGHFVPVTAANDVAPHVEMIRRNDVHGKQGWSRGQKLAVQAGAIVPVKRKYSSPSIAHAPTAGVRGSVVPVVLQPVNASNGSPASSQPPSSNAPQTANVLEFGDTDVHMYEPLSMLPPDHSIPVSQIFTASQPNSSHKLFLGSEQNNSSTVNEGAPEVGPGEKDDPMKSTDTDTSGSSQTSDDQTENGKKTVKSFSEDSGLFSIQGLENTAEPFSVESLQSACVTKPLFNFGTGRMTELLKAVQENIKENDVHELHVAETDSKNDTSVP